ncbi:MAG: neutral zinc metallopeptidase [Pseudomonadota bacterium]|nr:neutral zinc metallopeptidase [Pseudomonadota bacterium]
MKWRNRRQSNRVDDQRTHTTGKRNIGIKGGIGTAVLALVLWGVFGIDPSTTLGLSEQLSSQTSTTQPIVETEQSNRTKQFVSVVLADTEDTWQQIFAQHNAEYTPPTLVLFENRVQSACGQGQSAMGPFYCPADQRVYLDMRFFADMRQKFGIRGELAGSGESDGSQAGDFAQAYVIAHEVGHHVQTILGISQQVRQAQQQAHSETARNQLAVRQELQADCFAGIWAHHNQKRTQFLQAGDIEEAIDAASQIGDDRLQQRSQGYIVPESFTHGSSQQRVHWFQVGLKSGQLEQCDTFQAAI